MIDPAPTPAQAPITAPRLRALPVRRNLTLGAALSLVVAGALVVASLGAMLHTEVVYPDAALVRSFLPSDVVNLAILLPFLLGAMVLAWRGRLIDLDAVRARLLPVGPARTSGAILMVLGVFLLLRLAGLVYLEITGPPSPEPFDRGLWIANFVVGCPALLVTGSALWRREALGYVAGLVLLTAMAALCLVPFGLFWRQS